MENKTEPSDRRKTVGAVLGFASFFAMLFVMQKAFHLTGDSFVGWMVPAVIVGVLVYFFITHNEW